MSSGTMAVQGKRSRRARAGSSSWERFRRDLTAVLATLVEGQFLILSARHGHRFVQFARGPKEIRAETVSNNYLEKSEELTRRQTEALKDLGWNAPTHGDGEPHVPSGSTNFYRDFEEPLAYGRIARLSVQTLSKVFRVGRPADLEYKSFREPGGKDVVLPALGIDRESPAPAASPQDQTYDEARAVVLSAVRRASGKDGLEYDEDGDIPVHYGEALLFVRVSDTPRFVRVFTPVLTHVEAGPALLERLNELNQGANLVRFLHSHADIWASADVFAHPLVPQHVVQACHVVGEVANDLRDALKVEFDKRVLCRPAQQPALRN